MANTGWDRWTPVTAAMIVLDARLGEQQRPTNVLDGITARIPGLSG